MEEKNTMILLNKQTGKLETFSLATGELVTQEGAEISRFVYSCELAEAVYALLREGETFSSIAKMSNMPPLHRLYSWRKGHPDFKKGCTEAKKDRAEVFHDKAVAILEDTDAGLEKDDVAATKFRFESALKLAQVGDVETYNPKPQLLQAGAAPSMIVINTGINRDPITVENSNGEKIHIASSGGAIPKETQAKADAAAEKLGAEVTDIITTSREVGGSEANSEEEDQ